MTQSVTKVAVTDGGPLDLAAAILALAYGLDFTATSAASLKTALGLGNVQAHNVETAFSYPNGVGLVTEGGRTALYLFDSEQEELKPGAAIRRLGLAEGQAPADVLPASGDATAALPTAAPGSAAAADPAPAPAATEPTLVTGEPQDPEKVAAVPGAVLANGDPANLVPGVELPPAGDAPRETGTSDVADLPGVTSPVADPADTPAPTAGAGDLPTEAADYHGSAENEATAAGVTRNPEDGLIDPNAEELKTVEVKADDHDAFAEGREAFDTGKPVEANPYKDEGENGEAFDHDEWVRGWQQGEQDARPLASDQSGFHSPEA